MQCHTIILGAFVENCKKVRYRLGKESDTSKHVNGVQRK